jgi:hypothetical protein
MNKAGTLRVKGATVMSLSRQRQLIMPIKNLTLYSLPYIVGVASLIVAAHQIAPSFQVGLHPQSHTTEAAIFSAQVVNRSLKGDRLLIHGGASNAIGKEQRQVPTSIAPKREIQIGCERLSDFPGVA